MADLLLVALVVASSGAALWLRNFVKVEAQQFDVGTTLEPEGETYSWQIDKPKNRFDREWFTGAPPTMIFTESRNPALAGTNGQWEVALNANQ